jgi:hypothetical protein
VRAASTLLAELDNLNLPDDQTAELRQAAEEIAAKRAQPEPDEGKLRQWGSVIVKGLEAVTTPALGGTAARYIVELLGFAFLTDAGSAPVTHASGRSISSTVAESETLPLQHGRASRTCLN